jgi:hypothetical protein
MATQIESGPSACIATILAASKIRDGWHHPIDVVFGAIVGTAFAHMLSVSTLSKRRLFTRKSYKINSSCSKWWPVPVRTSDTDLHLDIQLRYGDYDCHDIETGLMIGIEGWIVLVHVSCTSGVVLSGDEGAWGDSR